MASDKKAQAYRDMTAEEIADAAAEAIGRELIANAIREYGVQCRIEERERAALVCERNIHPKKTDYAEGWDDCCVSCADLIRSLDTEET